MTKRKRWLEIIVVVAVAFCGLAACTRNNGVEAARDDKPPSLTAADQEFMVNVAQLHLAEIQLGRNGMEKSGNSEVKDFANMIRSDHTDALEDLTEMMKQKNVPPPDSPLDETQSDINRMGGLRGSEFDREFANMMVSGHQKALEMFRDAALTAKNPDLKDYVENLIPKLEMHLDKAQRLQSKLFSAPNKP